LFASSPTPRLFRVHPLDAPCVAVAATTRGMAVLRKGTTKHLLAASAKFRKALELDRYCALAPAGLAEALVRFSFLVADFPELAEGEINPLMVRPRGKGVVAVDVRLLLGGLS